MEWIDLVILVIVAWAAYQGYKEGIVVQLGGIIGIVVGIFLAVKLCVAVGQWLDIYGTLGNVIGFIVIFLAVVLVMAFLGRMLSKLFRFSGLGIFDKIGGVILAAVKVLLVVGVLLYFLGANSKQEWVKTMQSDSLFYKPLVSMSESLFPYVDTAKEAFEKMAGENEKENN